MPNVPDPAQTPVMPASGTTHLTPTERRLVETLRKEPTRIFGRAELVKIIMPETIVLPRTIDVHIRSLRKKFGMTFVKTVRGRGYCWGCEPYT